MMRNARVNRGRRFDAIGVVQRRTIPTGAVWPYTVNCGLRFAAIGVVQRSSEHAGAVGTDTAIRINCTDCAMHQTASAV